MTFSAVATSTGAVFRHDPLPVNGTAHAVKPADQRSSREVIAAVLSAGNTKREALMSSRRDRRISRVRHVCMYLLRKVSGLSLGQIGMALGRDETTVFHGCGRVGTAIERDDPEIVSLVNAACFTLMIESPARRSPIRAT